MGTSDKDKGGGSGKRRSSLPGSTKPYLIRAIYEWSIDNGLTPQVRVNARLKDVIVPLEYVREDQIVLNIHPQSVKALELGNEFLMCSARFSGRPFDVCIPIFAVMAVYAKENGVGIVFEESDTPPPKGQRSREKPPSNGGESGSKSNKKPDSSPHLKLVK